MKLSSPDAKIIFVVGPTASGKSALALYLAKKFNGSIVNIDSVQFYEGLYIGSAAPTEEEKQQVPHYLFSYIKAPNEMTAGQFIRDFYQLIETEKITSPIFIVGGTGFYIQALEKGMYDVPEINPQLKEEILKELSDFGVENLYQELIDFDPDTQVHRNDHYRVCRAIEVKRAFGKKMTDLKDAANENKNKLPFKYLKLGLAFDETQKEAYAVRVHRRSESMVKQGIIDETQHFIEQGYKDWAPLSSVGYLETKMMLEGKIEKDKLAEAITQATMKLVKKQKTWFKRDSSILWSNVFSLDLMRIEKEVKDFLNS